MNTEKDYQDGLERLLHSAVRKGNLKRVQLLVEHGADINTFDSEGRSLLGIASQHGHAEIVDYLARCAE